MNSKSITNVKTGIALTLIVMGAMGAMMAQSSAKQGYLAAPVGSETLTVSLDPSSMQLFANDDFKGADARVTNISKTIPAGKANELPFDLADKVTSLRWNLRHGEIVVFYENADLKGEQMVLWGSGQSSDIGKWDFNDKASRWAWFDVGGGDSSADSASVKLLPAGSESPSVAVPENSIQMFKDDKFHDEMVQMDGVTSTKAGNLHKPPGELDDSLTSLRWNLPEGVVVMLYEDANGKKDRVAIWGKGQLSSLDQWDFNDKVSRWSWAYIGAPAKSE